MFLPHSQLIGFSAQASKVLSFCFPAVFRIRGNEQENTERREIVFDVIWNTYIFFSFFFTLFNKSCSYLTYSEERFFRLGFPSSVLATRSAATVFNPPHHYHSVWCFAQQDKVYLLNSPAAVGRKLPDNSELLQPYRKPRCNTVYTLQVKNMGTPVSSWSKLLWVLLWVHPGNIKYLSKTFTMFYIIHVYYEGCDSRSSKLYLLELFHPLNPYSICVIDSFDALSDNIKCQWSWKWKTIQSEIECPNWLVVYRHINRHS